ncbi:hypothetical protein BKK49_05400 [Rodentibacter rarus]|uniref:type III toxin-antitoxin system ToxN/AbiQ family toxin n=1 Tax=Rodentibacter rarus TaxID=1908260 RepID=UPI0009863133|nr:type III toxin-antitoxin system ToxN/AbiQ family toxin [Rodentibacter rarus]OOF40968.1 hypothetical protein BKK49_05400 [Rodentibacter rarus]
MKIRFLHVKKEYIDYLKSIDNKVQDNYDESEHQKPYISGIKIEINNRLYLAPLTSYKDKYDNIEEKVIFKIVKKYKKREKENLGVVLLNNMIPLIDGVYSEINFNNFNDKYKSLLMKQYRVLSGKESITKINKIANDIYNEVNENKNSFFLKICCNFKLLEEACDQYQELQ